MCRNCMTYAPRQLIMIFILLSVISIHVHAKKTCSQFKNYKEAEIYFKAKNPGYKGLDRNHDGQPCEKLWKKSLSNIKQKIKLRIYKYNAPHGYGKNFSSISACEKEAKKLAKDNAGLDYSYKCEKN